MAKKRLPVVQAAVTTPRTETVQTPWNADDPGSNCMTCGACCGPFEGSSVEETWATMPPEEAIKLPLELFKQLVAPTPGDFGYEVRNSLHSGLVCVHLGGVIGRKVSCTIYAHRPKCCEVFEPNSPRCRMARAVRGLPLGEATYPLPVDPPETGGGNVVEAGDE